MGILYQVIGTAILCTTGINTGVIIMWPSSAIEMFSSKSTVLNRPMTENEISLLSSLSSIGGMITTLAAGFLLDKLGRKKCTIITALSLVLCWIVLAICKQVEVVLLCVFFSGIGMTVFLVVAIYVGEICQETIRGTMIAVNTVFYLIGWMILYLLAACLSYDALIYTGMSMSVTSLVLILFLKDSPVHLMLIGKEQEAAEAIAFFRQLMVTDKEVTDEINVIKSALNPELEDFTPESEKLNPDFESQTEKLSFWQIMKKSESSRRALLIVNVIIVMTVLQGQIAIEMYTESLFSEAMPSISPMKCSTLEAAIIVVSGTVAAYLADIAGRRALIIYGSIATGVCCVILGSQLQFQWGPNWLSGLVLYIYSVTYTIGAGTVPMILLAELFLPEVRSVLSIICYEWGLLWYAILLYTTNPILNAIGWGPVCYIFAIISFITALFCVFFLPETKGLTVEQMQPLFRKKKNHKIVPRSIRS